MQVIGILCATAAAFFWSAAVVMFKKSGEIFSPMALNLFKGVVTLLLLVPTLWFAGVPFFPVRPACDWLMFCISGILGITLADTFFFMALKRLGAGLWAVVDCLYLPLIIFASALFLNESIGIRGISGALLVIAAIAVDSYSRTALMISRQDFIHGVCFGVLAVVLIAGSVVIVKPLLQQTHVLWASFVRLLAGVVGLLAITLIHSDRRLILRAFLPSSAWKIVLPASIVGNYLAMIAWLAGFKYTLVAVAAVLNQLATIFTFVLAAIFLKEPVTLPRLIAIVLAVSGALLAATAV
jgi:drug/metabolite transporter (DMT)-like permease